MKIKQVPGGNWILPEEATEGFVTDKDILGISGRIYGRVAFNRYRYYAGGTKNENPTVHLTLQYRKNGVPHVRRIKGNMYEDDSGIAFSFNENRASDEDTFLQNGKSEVVELIADNHGSSTKPYGDLVFDDEDTDLVVDFFDDWAAIAGKIWRRTPEKGRFTVKYDRWKRIFGAFTDRNRGYVARINQVTSQNIVKVYVYELNGTKRENENRLDPKISDRALVTRISRNDHERRKNFRTAQSYAKKVLDHYNIK